MKKLDKEQTKFVVDLIYDMAELSRKEEKAYRFGEDRDYIKAGEDKSALWQKLYANGTDYIND